MSEVDLIIKLIGKIDVLDVEKDALLFAYQGFNPEMVIKHLAKIKEDQKIRNEDFQSDIRTLIAAGTLMGNVTDKNINKIKLEGKIRLNELYTKYKMKKGGISNDRLAVNLPRLMSTFPILASRCMMIEAISPKEFGNEMKSGILDKCFKTPVFPALIPRTIPKNLIHVFLVLSTCYTTEQSLAIGKDKSVESVFRKQFGFAKIAFGSSIPNEDSRKEYFSQLTFDMENMRKCFEYACSVIKSDITFPSFESWQVADLKFH
jgi:hypothetical protein